MIDDNLESSRAMRRFTQFLSLDQTASESLDEAHELMDRAELLLYSALPELAEAAYRDVMRLIRRAILWAPHEPALRHEIHAVGRLVHERFGCALQFTEGRYWVSCPVHLSHFSGGASVGGRGKTICSICGQDMLFCPHEKKASYSGVTARDRDGLCTICAKGSCDHVPGRIYDDVEAFGIIEDFELDHISYVPEPANPDCTFYQVGLRRSEALMISGGDPTLFTSGETKLYCHHCAGCTDPLSVSEMIGQPGSLG